MYFSTVLLFGVFPYCVVAAILRLTNLESSRSAVRWSTCASLTSLGLDNSTSDYLRLARVHSLLSSQFQPIFHFLFKLVSIGLNYAEFHHRTQAFNYVEFRHSTQTFKANGNQFD